ncbi:hypothetical protein BL1056 [Bifidobacterium longum NCC2705]|uniref:Uncharacterized protein n=1 Tax=Bifidobacterium longum (strain NCC 2705) TaxID=206672 RepID=Q8G5F4_BIFLO|nr:hypothetical protein BL1056 [Bifidobacterium longum NCC2705]QCH30184.1 Hypothetical protein Blongum51A_0585 [Bifidobacterium longum]
MMYWLHHDRLTAELCKRNESCIGEPGKSATTIPYGGMTRVKFPGRSLATSSQPHGSRSLRFLSVCRCSDNNKIELPHQRELHWD